ncbi:MAG: glycosyltransferase [Bacteroidetes bacterium]|nr:glycosyltransferase [Fibrella sp.]
MHFSVVIPVYNRPDELRELLTSLTQQTLAGFEVLVVEDGSTRTSDSVVAEFADKLTLRYFVKENTGQGFSRNYGFDRATGDYFVVFDSDTVIPPVYFERVSAHLRTDALDAYGGPDAASPDFTDTQKAISYAMTSLFTTGGIRGKTQNAGGTFLPRSFNMGLSRKTYRETGGFAKTNLGEDMELSARLIRLGYRVGLIPDAVVYHKRRGTLGAFFRQIINFGRTRVLLRRQYGIPIKLVHTFPVVFTLGLPAIPFFLLFLPRLGMFTLAGYGLFGVIILVHATRQEHSIRIGLQSLLASFVQLTAYGLGFLRELIRPAPALN